MPGKRLSGRFKSPEQSNANRTFNLEKTVKTHRSIEDILSAHADSLNQGNDITDQLLHEFEHVWPDLALLLVLARIVKKSMVPRPAPRPLVNLLREDLREGHPPAVQAAVRRRRWVWIGAITSVLATATGIVMWFYWRTDPNPQSPSPAG